MRGDWPSTGVYISASKQVSDERCNHKVQLTDHDAGDIARHFSKTWICDVFQQEVKYGL